MLPPHKIDTPVRFPIMTSEGETIGYVEEIYQSANRLAISGWAAAESVGIVFGKVQVLTKTSIERPDVVQAHPHLKAIRDDHRFGFSLESEIHDGPRFIAINLRNHSYYISFP